MENTIVAISTPIGTGGISIVRMSGTQSLDIIEKIIDKKRDKLQVRNLVLCDVFTKNFNEKALVVYFKSPNSYTGEDMIEVQCHGGTAIAKGILEELLQKGATLAENGEFTKRAFINGKISLEQAEGVIDMINAESDAQIRAGYNLLSGKLKTQVESLQNSLTDCLAEIEVAMDYPENDYEETTTEKVLTQMEYCLNETQKLIESSKTGRMVKNGINVALVGIPNVGKSSLLNALLNYERAIVTDIAGTTRDTIEESYIFNGIKFNIVDTAGIRESNDAIEKIGVEKSLESINGADIVLFVKENGKENAEEKKLFDKIINKNHIVVENKADLQNDFTIKNNEIKVSALTGKNIAELKQKLYDFTIDSRVLQSPVLITNERHLQSLLKAKENFEQAINGLENRIGLELSVIDIKSAWSALGEITGTTSDENIIDAIFSKFCLGK